MSQRNTFDTKVVSSDIMHYAVVDNVIVGFKQLPQISKFPSNLLLMFWAATVYSQDDLLSVVYSNDKLLHIVFISH